MATRRLEGQLKAHWKLDSLYGATVSQDSIGSNTLSIGSVASTTGKIYEAALFTRASSQSLGAVSNANLQSLKTISLWVKFTTISNDMTLVHKGATATAANSSLWIKYDTGNNRIQFQVGDGGGNSATCSTTGYSFAAGTWYFVVCRYNTTLSKLSISINGTLNNTAACSLTQYVETGTFYLGRDATGNYLDGALDEISISQSCLTIAEELILYNGGNGNQPPYLEGPWAANGAAGRYPRRLPPSFTEADNGTLFIAYGDEGVRKWDGLKTTFPFAGVPAPATKPVLSSAGEGRIIGERYGYVRYLDEDGRASNLSPISDPLNAWGTAHTITAATNASPIVITSATHGLTTGEQVFLQGIQGNTAANGTWTVTVVDANSFQLDGSAGNGDFLAVDTGRVAVTTLRDGAAAINEVQTITASGTPSGGTWTISFRGATSATIAYNANAAAVQSALESLVTIGAGNISVSGGALGTAAFTLTFTGSLAGTDLPAVTASNSGLSGATVTVSVSTLQDGSAGANEVQSFSLIGSPSGGTFTMTFDGQTTSGIAYNCSAATMQAALEALSNLAPGDVTCAGGAFPGSAITVTFGGAYANTNVSQITINPASLTGGTISAAVSTVTQGSSNLSTGLLSFWKMNESSGTRYDSVGSIDFTEFVGSISSVAGVISNAARLDSNEALSASWSVSGSAPRPSQDFSFLLWIRTTDVTSNNIADLCVCNGPTQASSVLLFTNSSGFAQARVVSNLGGTQITVTATNFGALSANTWYLVAVRWTSSTRVLSISINGGTPNTLTGSGTYDSSGMTLIQTGLSNSNGAGDTTDFDEMAVWTRVLTDADVTSYYNGGSGVTHPLSSGTNEVQRITVSGSPSSGSFTLTYDGQTTSAISYNASAATIDSTLEALSNIGSGQVSCTGGPLPGSTVDIEFTGTLAATNVSQMTDDDTLLKCSFTTTTPGSGVQNEIQRFSVNGTPTAGTWTATFGANTTSALAYNISAATLQSSLEGLASIGAGNIAVSGGPFPASFSCTFQGALASTNVSSMSASSSMTGSTPTLTVSVTTDGVAALNEEQQVFTAGTITGGTFTLTYSSQTTGSLSYLATAADVQSALRGLSNIGDNDVVCTGGPLPSPITLDFQGALAATNLSEVTVTNNVIGGGWAHGARSLTYSSLDVPTDRRVTKRQILRNKYGDATVFYVDIDTTDLSSTSLTTYNTDEMLGTAVPLQDSDGNDLNVVRHGEPPNWKRAIASFQNRLFLGVNHRSASGELSVTNASTTVTGEDAFFRTAYDSRTLYPQQTSNTQGYTIDSLSVPNQTLTIDEAYVGSTVSGLSYGIEMAPPEDVTIYFSEEDDPESWNLLNGQTITRNAEDGDFVGVMPLINSVVFVMQHRLHRLTFRTSPLPSADGGDGRIAPASWRGGINNRCGIVAEGKAYILDNRGVYTFNESAAEDISDELQPMFGPGNDYSIYWAARDYFHACYFAESNTMKWFVTLRDGTYPYHAICYHTQRKRWWIEQYPWPVVSSCEGRINGHQVVFLGSSHRRVFVMTDDLDGISEGTSSTLRGTATSSSAFSLTDSTAAFSTALANVPVTIVSGKGAGQQRLIVGSTTTKLTLKDSWNIAPDTTSVYQIGGVKWTWKGTQLRLSQKGSETDRGVETTFLPNSRESTITLRTYADFSETPNALAATLSDSDGVSVTADSGDVIIDLTHSTGFVGFYNDAFFTGRGTHQRYITAELEGVTNGERQKVSELSVIGVES